MSAQHGDCQHGPELHALTENGPRTGPCSACRPPAGHRVVVRRLLSLLAGLVCLAVLAGLTVTWGIALQVAPSRAWDTFSGLLAAGIVLGWAAGRLIRRRPAPARHRPAGSSVGARTRSGELEKLLSDVEQHNLRYAPQRRRNRLPRASSWTPVRQRNERSGR